MGGLENEDLVVLMLSLLGQTREACQLDAKKVER